MPFFGAKGAGLPVAVGVFPDEVYEAPRTRAEQAYPSLVHCNRLAAGGHFAAREQPELFGGEVRGRGARRTPVPAQMTVLAVTGEPG